MADLALQELFRPVSIREGDRVVKMPAVQAIVRSQIALAAKGNGPAQRAVIELTRALQGEGAAGAPPGSEQGKSPVKEISDLEAARRIAFILSTAERELDPKD